MSYRRKARTLCRHCAVASEQRATSALQEGVMVRSKAVDSVIASDYVTANVNELLLTKLLDSCYFPR